MAAPPSLRKLSVEQFADAPEWFGNVVRTLNPFITTVTDGLSGQLSAENFRRQTERLDFTTKADVVDTFADGKLSFRNKLNTPPKSLLITQIAIAEAAVFDEESERYVGEPGEPSFSNSWVNFASGRQGVGFLKQAGRVWLFGSMKSGTINTTAFTLPEAYRPAYETHLATESNGAYGKLTVATDGKVTPAVGSNTSFSLDGLSFKAATGSFAAPIGQPIWQFRQNGQVEITFIPGLRPLTKYSISVVCE